MMLHTGNNTTTDKDNNTISRKQKVKTILRLIRFELCLNLLLRPIQREIFSKRSKRSSLEKQMER